MRPVAMRPTFIKNAHAYLCNLRNYKFLSKFLESDSQGIWSKFLYPEIQHLSLIEKIYLDYEKSPQEKNKLSISC